ncbi:uncharacterized protein LOC112058159 [Bicyclus anynana]|uniref:Uncharacterized protein LOC112058159 n=1 Tax=Bicyclus anynana TaxID=110368 RepID=A0A6J1P9W3_BICAN|nr:uncharacterized protein LOC112058159 [Bicyclus anynana]
MSSTRKRVSSPTTKAAFDQEEHNGPSKRIKLNSSHSSDIQTLKKKNFVKACELVSQKAYFNYAERLQLIYIPVCLDRSSCMHSTHRENHIREMPQKVMKLINIEMEASNWCGALEVCIMSITPTQYLSDTALKNVVEIMLNAHEDLASGYTIPQVLDKCTLVLTLHFTTHNPCLHEKLRKVYNDFLTSPMDRKERTRTNRTMFNSEKGILNFCLTRLEYEIGAESADCALLDKTENTPEELRETIKGLFYQKEQFDIFEMLDRTERINRLMAVLHSIIELLQFDLAIGQSILNSGVKNRKHKPLMSCILDEEEVAPKGCPYKKNEKAHNVTICRRIFKLFAYFIHLDYPEQHIHTMTLWLNSVMEMFYMKENRANSDYPHIHAASASVINELYDIITELPPKSIINILERIKPPYIRHQISHDYCESLLSTDEHDTIKIVIYFLKETKWNNIPKSKLMVLKKLNEKRVKPNKLLEHLSDICKNAPLNLCHNKKEIYPKFSMPSNKSKSEQSTIISALYIALQSYLESYGIQSIQETLQELNESLTQGSTSENSIVDSSFIVSSSYSVTDQFIRKHRQIFEMLKDLILTIQELETEAKNVEVLNIFKNIFN